MVDPLPQIEIRYRCPACMTDHAAVTCDARLDGEDIAEWLHDTAMRAVHIDHLKRSPQCRHRTADIKIPIADQTQPLGSA